MQITHEEARKLINLASDGRLSVHQKQVLDSHLESCNACQRYAGSIRDMESILRPLLRQQWNQQPLPFSVQALSSRETSRISNSMLLATRVAAISVMFMVFMFSAWQLTQSKPSIARSVSANIPLIPIPSTSTQLVSTNTQTKSCEGMIYTVQGTDTLEDIAARFSTTKEELLHANDLNSDTIAIGMKLVIPVCTFTPTGTAKSLTTTPILHQITSTPGG